MFERYSNQGVAVIIAAEQEARLLGHDYIGTEHLVLGLLAQGQSKRNPGVAGAVFSNIGVTLKRVREIVAEMPKKDITFPVGPTHFTPNILKTFDLTLPQAMAINQIAISTEHILLALTVGPEDTTAQEIFTTLRKTNSEIREAVGDALGIEIPDFDVELAMEILLSRSEPLTVN